MLFDDKSKLYEFLKNSKHIGDGSQGICYLKNQLVYKIFYNYSDEDEDFVSGYDESELLRFKNIDNKMFVWPQEIIRIEDKIVGYISKYKKANNLYKINPLLVDLNKLRKSIIESQREIKIISEYGVKTYDMMYNILYGDRLYSIDTDEFSYSDIDTQDLQNRNIKNFEYELFLFLIDNYFENIVLDNKELKEIYEIKKDIILFLDIFKKRISELAGKEVNKLEDVKKYIRRNRNHLYIRELY